MNLLNKYERDKVEIIVHPWCDLSKRVIPQPKGVIRSRMFETLLDIYINWKEQLDKIGQPYYLKIWYFDQRFSASQVVCAIGERIDYYENLFFKPVYDKTMSVERYNAIKPKINKFSWDYRFDEDHIDKNWIGEQEQYLTIKDYEDSKKWYKSTMQKPHRTTIITNSANEVEEYYSFKRGDLWIGELKDNAS